ncbi:hypothetical protein Golax_025207, partial [Gossypium laxum]|nr:hypothetical protein [Gossypium laxum]
VTAALRGSGLESSNLIIGIDFTKSNEWTGQVSFNNRSLHAIGAAPNPYEKAISIIGKTLAPFDDDNLIPCLGFGDATTHDHEVFSFHSDHSSCHGFEEVLDCYKKIVPNLRLSGSHLYNLFITNITPGPTSYAPVIDAAIDVVESSGGQFHVLVIIADGQVTRSVNTSSNELSPQEEKTINSIVNASSHPLSIVLVGVGDGPWEDMKKFDDKIPARAFDNFQVFVVHRTGKAKKVVPRPPPAPYRAAPRSEPVPTTVSPSPALDDRTQACPICLTSAKDLAFGCGHMTCRECGSRLSNCPICRQRITNRLRLFA